MTISIFKENCCPELVEPQSGTKIFLKNGNRPENDFPAPRPARLSRPPAAGRATRARRLSRTGRRSGSPSVGWDCSGSRWIDRSDGVPTNRHNDSAGGGVRLSLRLVIDPSPPRLRSHGWAARARRGEPNWWPGERLRAEVVSRVCRGIDRLAGKSIDRLNESLIR